MDLLPVGFVGRKPIRRAWTGHKTVFQKFPGDQGSDDQPADDNDKPHSLAASINTRGAEKFLLNQSSAPFERRCT